MDTDSAIVAAASAIVASIVTHIMEREAERRRYTRQTADDHLRWERQLRFDLYAQILVHVEKIREAAIMVLATHGKPDQNQWNEAMTSRFAEFDLVSAQVFLVGSKPVIESSGELRDMLLEAMQNALAGTEGALQLINSPQARFVREARLDLGLLRDEKPEPALGH